MIVSVFSTLLILVCMTMLLLFREPPSRFARNRFTAPDLDPGQLLQP